MESEKFIPFMVQYSGVLLFAEAYFLIKWRTICKNRNWNPLAYKIPVFFSLIMLLVTFYTIWIQVADIIPSDAFKYIFAVKSIWYLPKLGIVPFMMLRDIFLKLNSKLPKVKHTAHNLLITNKLATKKQNLQLAYASNFNGEVEINNEKNINKNMNKNIDLKQESPKIPDKTRRGFVKKASWALAGLPFFVISKGVFETTYDFKIFKKDLFLKGLPKELDGITVVQISDIHAGSFVTTDPIQEVVRMVNAIKGDIVMLTGDFVNFHQKEYDLIQEEMKKIKGGIGVYGCLGNHDHYMDGKNLELLKKRLDYTGVDLLVNENRKLKINNTILQLAGSDNTGYNQNYADFDKTLEGLEEQYPTLLMTHDPTNWDRSVKDLRKVDLMLSGHTHGGQIGWEFAGQILSPARVAYRQFAGHYKFRDQHLYINRGIGTTGPPVRVGVKPEITYLTLRKDIRA